MSEGKSTNQVLFSNINCVPSSHLPDGFQNFSYSAFMYNLKLLFYRKFTNFVTGLSIYFVKFSIE